MRSLVLSPKGSQGRHHRLARVDAGITDFVNHLQIKLNPPRYLRPLADSKVSALAAMSAGRAAMASPKKLMARRIHSDKAAIQNEPF
jgi:hypothetical protein